MFRIIKIYGFSSDWYLHIKRPFRLIQWTLWKTTNSTGIFIRKYCKKHRMTGKMCLINEYDSPRDVQSALPTSPWSYKKDLMLIIPNVWIKNGWESWCHQEIFDSVIFLVIENDKEVIIIAASNHANVQLQDDMSPKKVVEKKKDNLTRLENSCAGVNNKWLLSWESLCLYFEL